MQLTITQQDIDSAHRLGLERRALIGQNLDRAITRKNVRGVQEISRHEYLARTAAEEVLQELRARDGALPDAATILTAVELNATWQGRSTEINTTLQQIAVELKRTQDDEARRHLTLDTNTPQDEVLNGELHSADRAWNRYLVERDRAGYYTVEADRIHEQNRSVTAQQAPYIR